MRKGTKHSPESLVLMSKRHNVSIAGRKKMSETVKKTMAEGRGIPVKNQREKHDYLVSLVANLHKGWGAMVLYTDLPGQKRPDIIYYKNGKIIAEDIKTTGEIQIDGEWTVG